MPLMPYIDLRFNGRKKCEASSLRQQGTKIPVVRTSEHNGAFPTRLTKSRSIKEMLSLIGKSHPLRVFYLLFNCHAIRARPIRATCAHPELVPPTPREDFFHLQLGNRPKDSIRVDRSHGLQRTLQIRRLSPFGWVERLRPILIFRVRVPARRISR